MVLFSTKIVFLKQKKEKRKKENRKRK